MYNCVKIVWNGRLYAIVHSIDHADMLRRLILAEFPDNGPVFCDWAYIEGIGF